MGTAQTNNIIQLGGAKNSTNPTIILPYANLGNIVQLSMFVSSSSTNHFYMLSRWAATGSSGQYQVANGKTFRAVGVWFYGTTGANGGHILFGTGTAALLTDDAVLPPTGAVYYSSGSTVFDFTIETANSWTFLPIYVEFAQNLYPFIKFDTPTSGLNVLIMGTEQ